MSFYRMLIATSLLLISFTVLSSERVGDMIDYRFNIQGYRGNLQERVISFDASNRSYTIQTTTQIDGRAPEIAEEIIKESDMVTQEMGNLIVENCSLIPGTLEVVIVEGQAYPACKVAIQEQIAQKTLENYDLDLSAGGFAWLGPFPVTGFVKLENAEFSMIATNFNWN